MSKLQAEQCRLYLVAEPATQATSLIDAQGQTRALGVELAHQAGWDAVAALCHGIQNELALPTPALAVSGGAGFQVWLSLVAPVPVAEAHGFLAAVCQRFLSQVPARHVQIHPRMAPVGHAPLVPALQEKTGRWSAFVAPGLACMFADEPWLDVPPGDDAQAQLLCRLESISAADFDRVKREVGVVDTLATRDAEFVGVSSGAVLTETDPRRFLLSVMNDPAVDMTLRIDAAKALLPR